MYGGVLVFTINFYFSKVPYPYRGTILARYRVPVPRYFYEVPCPPMAITITNATVTYIVKLE